MPRPLPFKLRLPAFAAPMFLLSGPELVIAACEAGLIGAFPTPNARNAETLERWMREITAALAAARRKSPEKIIGPWCANLITHSSNARLSADLALVAKYQPPLAVTALGSPKPAIGIVHGYGGLVFADVISVTLAKKAAAAGADGLVCVSAGAGGHTGFLSPFAFISAVREFFDGYVVLGGGISDGAGIAGAIAAGADFAYLGTSFIAADESMAAPAYKQMAVQSGIDDLVISAGVTGTAASWLKQSLRNQGYDPDNMPAAPDRDYDSRNSGAKRWKDLWAAGQGVGSVKAIEPAAAIAARLETEYFAALARLSRLNPGSAP